MLFDCFRKTGAALSSVKTQSVEQEVVDVSIQSLTEKLEGALILRFFKNVPTSLAPVPAISISEGEDIFLVAALRSGG